MAERVQTQEASGLVALDPVTGHPALKPEPKPELEEKKEDGDAAPTA